MKWAASVEDTDYSSARIHPMTLMLHFIEFGLSGPIGKSILFCQMCAIFVRTKYVYNISDSTGYEGMH